MRLPSMEEYRPSCCVEKPVCLLPDVIHNYAKLCERYYCMTTKRRRLLEMAEPKVRREKYQKPCKCPEAAVRRIEIVQADPPMHTRTEQLAYPPPSNLLDLKKHPAYKKFPMQRQTVVNRNLRKSLLSLYSRLGNTQPPKPPEKRAPLSPQEKKRHEDRIKTLARPKNKPKKHKHKKEKKTTKQDLRSRKSHRKDSSGDGPDLRRINKLAKPKKFAEQSDNEWHLTEALKTYNPTRRILAMAMPKVPFQEDHDDTYEVKPAALRYKASPRIIELARSQRLLGLMEKQQENPFKVSRNALKAKTTDRIVQLAEPKEASDSHIRAHPFQVPRRALKAKLTPRLEELAKPKTIH